MKQQQRIDKFKQVLEYLNKTGVLEQATVHHIGCPEPDRVIERLLQLGGDKLSPTLLAEAFAQAFNLEVYSSAQHGQPICKDETEKGWLYANNKLFLTNPFISPAIRGLLNSEVLAKSPLKGYGVLQVSEQNAVRHSEQYKENARGVVAKKIVMKWLSDALQAAASDLQIIPIGNNSVLIKQRIDGKLHPIYEWTYKDGDGVCYKHLCNVILNECKQVTGTFNRLIDSHFRFKDDGGSLTEVRVSMRPIFIDGINKPAFFLRFLGGQQVRIAKLTDLKIFANTKRLLKDITAMTDGLCVFTGPTGSGKTTTIYTILNEIHRRYPYKSIQTLEDPVEQNLQGIEQTQISGDEDSLHNNSLDFEAGIRSMMRTDVDLILVGEIRDQRTAQQAMRAGLTGHGVLTTLHTIDALGVIDRLVDFGIEKTQLASWLRFVSAQRLVAKVCSHCASELVAQDYYRHLKYQSTAELKVKVANSEGCRHCRGGYHGRALIIEVIAVDSGLQQLLNEDASVYEMRAYIKQNRNYLLLEDYALQLWLQGETTLEALSDVFGYAWGVPIDSLALSDTSDTDNHSALLVKANGSGRGHNQLNIMEKPHEAIMQS
ncbi:MAG: Flp pilus assembly complex ATPase component TadA [Chromatiales bacterium]|nr:Flp pilus assembly complex ATPase component TadA [Chromatiales bacterium]